MFTASGTIKWFDAAKGFGFITPDSVGPDIMIHAKVLKESGFKTASQGSPITVAVEPKEGKWRATKVLTFEEKSPVHIGTISGLERAILKWFDREKGFGFLTRGEGTEDIFIHMEVIRSYGILEVMIGKSFLIRFFEDEGRLKASEIYPDRG